MDYSCLELTVSIEVLALLVRGQPASTFDSPLSPLVPPKDI